MLTKMILIKMKDYCNMNALSLPSWLKKLAFDKYVTKQQGI